MDRGIWQTSVLAVTKSRAQLSNWTTWATIVNGVFVTPWTAARQTYLSFTISQSLLKLMSIELLMLSNRLILYCPLLLLPSIFPSIRVISRVSSSHQVVTVLELQLQHQSFQRIFRVESKFRYTYYWATELTDWFRKKLWELVIITVVKKMKDFPMPTQ